MDDEKMFITINHLDDYGSTVYLRVGQKLKLKKDRDNCYDDEAIAVYDSHDTKTGYVANSVSTVARGTLSAGRVYDRIAEESECLIRFIYDDMFIAQVV